MGQLHVTVPLSPSSVGSLNASPVQLFKTANTLGLGRCAVCSHVFSAGQTFFECYLCLNSACATKACSPRRHKIEHEISIVSVKLASPSSIEASKCGLCTEQRTSSYYCDACDYSVCRECWRLKDAAQSHPHRVYTVKDAIQSPITSDRKPKLTVDQKEAVVTPPETPLEVDQAVESPLAIQQDLQDNSASSKDKKADATIPGLEGKEAAPLSNLEHTILETSQTGTASFAAPQDEHPQDEQERSVINEAESTSAQHEQTKSVVDEAESTLPQDQQDRSVIDKAESTSAQKDDKPPSRTADINLTSPETPLTESPSKIDDDVVSEAGSIELNIPSYFGSFDTDASSRKPQYQPPATSQLTPAPLKIKPVQRKSLAVSAVIPPASIDQIRRAAGAPPSIPQPVRSLTSHPPMYAPAPTYPNQAPPQRASYPAPCYGSVPNQAPVGVTSGYVAAPYIQLPRNTQPVQASVGISNGYVAGPYAQIPKNPQSGHMPSQLPLATRTVSAPNMPLQAAHTQGPHYGANHSQMTHGPAPQGQVFRPRAAQKKLTAYSDKTVSKIKTLSKNPKLKKFLKSKQFKVGAIVGTKLILKVGSHVLNQTTGIDLGDGIDGMFDGFGGGGDIGIDSITTEDVCVDGDGEVVVDSVVVEYPDGEEVFVDTTLVEDATGDTFVSETIVSDNITGDTYVDQGYLAQDFTGSTCVDQGYTSQVVPGETFVEQDYAVQDSAGNTYMEQDYVVQDATGNTYMEQDVTVQDAAGDTYTSQEIVVQDAAGDTFISENSTMCDSTGMNYGAVSSVYENTAYGSYMADGFAARSGTYGVY